MTWLKLLDVEPLTASMLAAMLAVQEPLTYSMLEAAPPQERRLMLGKRLFPIIRRMFPDISDKLKIHVTRMLIDCQNAELVHMLADPDSLKAKAQEALVVLQAQEAGQNVTS